MITTLFSCASLFSHMTNLISYRVLFAMIVWPCRFVVCVESARWTGNLKPWDWINEAISDFIAHCNSLRDRIKNN